MRDGKFVILYVDDDPDFLEGMRTVLEASGYIMVEADSAETGIPVFKKEEPDLILLDLMMEEVDAGTAFVRELQRLGANVPILMVSSVGDNLSLSADYAELGLDGIFQKPVDPDILLTVLKSKLDRATKEQPS
jgi:DNA-binding response OmpR family regulator